MSSGGDANNGDSGDRKSAAGCCGSGLNLFSSGDASSVFAATASGGGEDDRGATTPSPPPDAEDFLCNLGESPLDIVIFAFPFYIAEAASRFETSFFKQHRVEGSSLS